jgi:hypothetical protein
MTKEDTNFITAAAINLYIESLRRGANRVLLAPQDIDILYELIHILTNPVQITIVAADNLRTRTLTEEEQTRVMTATEEEIEVPESLRRH